MEYGSETAELTRERRNIVKNEYGHLYDEVSEILFQNDPIGINFEDNTDEYEPEVGTILPRLKHCNSSDDVLTVIHEEFQKWFSGDAGPKENYSHISEEVWKAWLTSELYKN